MKKLLLSLGTIVTVVAPITLVISCGTTSTKASVLVDAKDLGLKTAKYDVSKMKYFNQETFNANAEYSEKNNFTDYKPKNESILDTAKDANINLYYTPAVAPFSNLLRLSMLTPNENHLYTIEKDGWENFQAKVNKEKLQDFYRNNNPKEDDKSSVKGISGNSKNERAGSALTNMESIIKQNPDKKINIWWNCIDTDQIGENNLNVFDLGGYKNVNIQLIEDGSSMGPILNNVLDRAQNHWNPATSGNDQVFLAPLFVPGNIKSWVSDDGYLTLNQINKTGRDYDLFNTFEYQTLSDLIFNTRKDGARLSSLWPAISGLDWKDAADIVETAKTKSNKPSLIVLGSYHVDGETHYVESLCKKYGDKYNIFYKGHPGHMIHTLTLTNWKNKAITPEEEKVEHKNSLFILDPMISSEELTRDHVVPTTGKVDGEKYIQFDKVIAVNHTGAISKSNFPNLDITKDVIEIFSGPEDIKINPSEDPTSTNWASEAAWLATLK